MVMPTTRFLTVILGIPFNKKGQVLLSQRHAPQMPTIHHKWQLIGGGVEFGEQPEQALAREFQEELQLGIKILSPYPIIRTSTWSSTQLHNDLDTHATLIAYIVEVDPGQPNWSNDPETADVRWWSFAEVSNLDMLPHTIETISEAVELYKKLGVGI
jgi:8-oxo-dGTP pyrophosphatase MutT (NUDIX family)